MVEHESGASSREPAELNSPSDPAVETSAAEDQAAAAREAATEAAEKARAMANEAAAQFKALDFPQQVYIAALVVVLLFGFAFKAWYVNVVSDGTPTPGAAQAMAEQEARINLGTTSLVNFGYTGMFAWWAALIGLGISVYSVVAKSREAWMLLAQAGAAAFCLLLLLLLWLLAFRDLEAVSATRGGSIDVDTTLLGFWIPLLASAAATFFSLRRIGLV